MIYSWHQSSWERLNKLRHGKRMPHAVILSGLSGTGIEQFTTTLAESLLCHNITEDGYACGHCKSCLAMNSGAHPDFLHVGVPEGKQQIPIDAIRNLQDFITLTGSFSSRRVVIISLVEAMNRFSANSLLKTLEEPTGDAVLLLTTRRFSRLLPTIRSRCLHEKLPMPNKEEARSWLNQQALEHDAKQLLDMAQGKPLLAVEYANDDEYLKKQQQFESDLVDVINDQASVVSLGEKWSKTSLKQLVEWQLLLIQKTLQQTILGERLEYDTKIVKQLMSKRIAIDSLWQHYDCLIQYYRLTDYPLNSQSFTEHMICLWSKYQVSPHTQ